MAALTRFGCDEADKLTHTLLYTLLSVFSNLFAKEKVYDDKGGLTVTVRQLNATALTS